MICLTMRIQEYFEVNFSIADASRILLITQEIADEFL